MAQTLTEDLYNSLQGRVTDSGFTLEDAIKTGVDTPHLGVGAVFGDSDSYEAFKDLYDPIIQGWHNFSPTDTHVTDMDVSKLTNMDKLDMDYIKSTRVRA